RLMHQPGLDRHRSKQRLAWVLLALASLALVATACSGAEDPAQPPTISYGTDTCTRCGMIISDAAYASAYRMDDGEVRLFDDLGEMLLHHRAEEEPVVALFVHDQTTHAWLRAEQAWYVESEHLRTPMGFGIVALSTQQDAQALAAQVDGHVVSWSELLQRAE